MSKINIIGSWSEQNIVNCIFRDSSLFNNDKDTLKPSHFYYVKNHNFGITHSNAPMLIDDLLVRFIKFDHDEDNFTCKLDKIRKLDLEQREFYAKMYILSILNYNVSSHKDFIEKLDLFGEVLVNKLFTEVEQHMIIENLLNSNNNVKFSVACELVHRGFEFTLVNCMKYNSLGMLLYYIRESRKIKHVVEQTYVNESSYFNEKIEGYGNSKEQYAQIKMEEPMTKEHIIPFENTANYKEMNINPNDVQPLEELKNFYKIRLDELIDSNKKNPTEKTTQEIDRLTNILDTYDEPKSYFDKPSGYKTISINPNDVNPSEDIEHFFTIRLSELIESNKKNPLEQTQKEIARISKILGKGFTPDLLTISENQEINENEEKSTI